MTRDENNHRISEGLRLAWKRRKAAGSGKKPVERLSPKQLKKLALYLKYIAFILERGDTT